MRLARILGVATALLATAAVAAPGDALVVTGDVVNVRAGPGADNPVLFQTRRDQRVVERARTDGWVQVNVEEEAAAGWIHHSLLKVVQTAAGAAVEPAAGRGAASKTEALDLFRSNVTELNARALAVAGVELFTGAEPGDGGTVQVMVTDVWNLVPEAGQRSYTNVLFDRWRAVAVPSEQLRLQVVDPSGTVVSEKSEAGTP